MPDGHEDVAKDAILEKVMKGRQLTDLMLRCKSQWRSFLRAKTVFQVLSWMRKVGRGQLAQLRFPDGVFD
jgi:hypothetical protein